MCFALADEALGSQSGHGFAPLSACLVPHCRRRPVASFSASLSFVHIFIGVMSLPSLFAILLTFIFIFNFFPHFLPAAVSLRSLIAPSNRHPQPVYVRSRRRLLCLPGTQSFL